MELRVPRNTAYIQDHTILGPNHTLEPVGDGEFRWSLKRSDGGGDDEESGSFREDDVVLICRESEQEPPVESEPGQHDGEDPMLLPPSGWPAAAPVSPPSPATAGYTIFLVRENPDDDDDEPYRLSCVSAPRLPQGLLDRHLLAAVPAHLVGGPKAAPELHVVVSTKSGTGLAQAVYNTVLEKLLAAVLGLRASDDLTPPDSPGGGGSARPKVAAAADADARASRPSYSLFVTQSPHSIRQLARSKWSAEALRRRLGNGEEARGAAGGQERRRRRRQQQQLIVLLSGDGGVVDLLNGAGEPEDTDDDASSLPAIALLPLGTGNALFHSLHRPLYGKQGGRPSHLVRGLRTLFRGVSAPLPTFRASFSPGSTLVPPAPPAAAEEAAVDGEEEQEEKEGDADADSGGGEPVDHLVGAIVASYGLHAQLVWESDTPEYRRHGAKRFGMAAAQLLKIGHAYDAEVRLKGTDEEETAVVHPRGRDGEASGDRFTYVLAAMVSNLERTFTISPASRPLDGRLWLVSFGAVGAEKTMEIMQAAYDDGAHVGLTWGGKEGKEQSGDGDRVIGYDEADGICVVTHEEDPRWRKVCVDGTIVELPRHGSMTVSKMRRPRFRVLVDGGVLV